ncbi:VCBS repeat-containing protein [Verrucomicrobia bacterium]|nr:VCBS repeat-containing protein [Verrucomicrobiota bacterium]
MSFLISKVRAAQAVACVFVSLFLSFNSLIAEGTEATHWGFGPLEMFPIESQIQLVCSLDANNDGLSDLIVSNPRKSELTLLLNQTGHEGANPEGNRQGLKNVNDGVNRLPPDSRFKTKSILIQSRPKALVAGALDQDGLPEIIFYDDRETLTVLWNGKEGAWSEKTSWRITDGISGLKSLMIRDLNMDALPDIALLGESQVSIFYNKGGRQFDQPRNIQIPSGVTSFEPVDVNQDHQLDLVFHVPNRKDGLYVSLRNTTSFGNFIQVPSIPFAKVFWQHDTYHGKVQMLAISDHLDQLMAYELGLRPSAKSTEKTDSGALQMIRFPEFSGIKRGVCWADMNWDGRDDCLVSDPDAGLLNVFLSNQQEGWDEPRIFPSLTGVQELTVMDWGRDGGLEVFLLSKDEDQIGHAHWDSVSKIMTYPEKLPSLSKPLLMQGQTAGAGHSSPSLVVLHENDQGWAVSTIGSDLSMQTQSFQGRLKGIPERLMLHDLDQDDWVDCLIFTPYEALICLRQKADDIYETIELAPPGGSWQGGWATSGDLNADGRSELIMPFKNMVRAYNMTSRTLSNDTDTPTLEWALQVVGQINGPSNTSNLRSGVVLQDDEGSETNVALFDISGSRLHVAEQDSKGVWRVISSQDMAVNELVRLQQLENEGSQEILLLCEGKHGATLNTIGGQSPILKPIGEQRSMAREARLQSLLTGDFDQDGMPEVFALETSEHRVECFQLESDQSFASLNQWSVFEKRSYRNQGAAFPEPKEGVIADFTGDELLDLCLIVHDRVILYPQRAWTGTQSAE